jgi:RNA polymerase sigma-70 factor (ECF subfamily)
LNIPDELLVMQAREGNQDAFVILFQRYKGNVYTCLRRVIRNEEIIEDLWQSLYIKAWSHIQSLREPSQFKYWLLRIARNLAFDWLRQRRREKTGILEGEASPLDPIDDGSGPEVVVERLYVRYVLAEMEPVLRDVLLLKTIGYSPSEIAQQLGYKEGTVVNYLCKARERFRQLYCLMDHTDENSKENRDNGRK